MAILINEGAVQTYYIYSIVSTESNVNNITVYKSQVYLFISITKQEMQRYYTSVTSNATKWLTLMRKNYDYKKRFTHFKHFL